MISLFRGNKRVRTTSSSSKKKKQKSPQEKRRMDFLSPVLKLIGTLLLNEYARITGISDKLKAWQDMLPTIQLYLDSADERMMLGDTATATWLSDLRDVAYDMEDLLEEFSAEAKREAPKLQALSKRTRLPQRLIACCSRFSPPTLISDHHMANQIEEVGRRLYGINSRIDMLKLVQNPTSKPTNDWPHFITTSEPEPNFVGRGEEIKELLVRLTGSEATYDSSRPFNVVSILGMSGLGKTTLAQELYEKAGFEHKAWACVSDVFDKAAITKSILDHFQPSLSSVGMDLNQLQTSLREKLSRKKFLIVLDDVWNDDYNDLESLVRPLYSGSKGSRILLTTRNLEVTKSVGDPHPMRLDLLPLEDCVSLLAYHSLDKKNFEQHPLLRDSAVQLAEKCKRLPLSIKTIGRLLRFKTGKKEWDRLLTHSIWSKEGKIPSALKLSYLHLPIHLRRCFAACAVFPKDYMFDQDEVIRMWIIHGLLQKGTSQTYRQVGMEYLLQLEAVSLFQKVRDEEGSYYSMHNLVNDLAKSIDDCSYYSSDEYKDGSGCHGKSLGRVRHASIVTQSYESLHSKRFDVYRQMKKLRTFSAFQISTFRESTVYVSGEVICELTMNMKNLRMLSLSCFRVSDLPDRIGELKLLRCIDLSHTTIEVLPESICDLVELQSLLLRECHKLKELPENIYRLTKLLHLDITGPNRLQEMPPRIGDLTNLEILSDFVVGKEVGRDLKQLGPLQCLQRGLKISNLLAVDDIKDASVANLPGKEGVLDLSLDWGSYSGVSRENDHQFELLQHLQPSENIESLNISEYGGKRFSSWFDNPLRLKYVVRITLAYCRSVDSLPPLGKLPSLESLDISGLDSLSSIGAEFYGTEKPYFPKLRSLSFTTMKSWKKWLFHGENENDQPFPCLRQLQVFHCPKLNGGCSLRLPSLVEIDIDSCNGEMLNCLAGLTSMTKMEIENIPYLVHFDRRFQTSWVSLEEMTINNCPQFKSFVDGDGEEQLPPKLKKLEMIDCGDIVKLPDDLSGLTSLKEMSIFHCYKLSSFPSEGLPVSLRKLMLYDCHKLPQSLFELLGSLEELTLWDLKGLVSIRDIAPKGSPVSQSLRELNIEDCTSLTTLTDSLQYLSALSDLSLIDCPELEMDIFLTLPYNLSSFWLYKCPKVKSLPQDMYRLTSLKQLSIGGCEGITSFPNLPCSLSSFKLDSCPNVNYLPQDMHRVTSLKKLSIRDCQGITRFPDLPCNLSSFKLDSCPNVNNLPQDMHSLLSLKKLSIRYCEGITSLPRGGLPPNMESLVIWSCRNLNQPIGEWGLRDLTALRELKIMGRMEWMDEMEVFPPPRSGADWSGILPSSLLKLTIGEMEKLEKVGGGLRHHLTSLKYLGIYSCERMRWLPEDGLPDTLEHLGIFRCSLLREKCRKGEGEYWHSHLRLIPQIEFS